MLKWKCQCSLWVVCVCVLGSLIGTLARWAAGVRNRCHRCCLVILIKWKENSFYAGGTLILLPCYFCCIKNTLQVYKFRLFDRFAVASFKCCYTRNTYSLSHFSHRVFRHQQYKVCLKMHIISENLRAEVKWRKTCWYVDPASKSKFEEYGITYIFLNNIFLAERNKQNT